MPPTERLDEAVLEGSLTFEKLDLRVLEGPDKGTRRSFGQSVIRLGTEPDNHLVLTDGAVSGHHAELRRSPEGILLVDLESTNGTFVGELRVKEAVLAPGTELVLGKTRLGVYARTEEHVVTVREEPGFGELVGASPRMRELYGKLRAAGPTTATVLITGESGTGKELAARTLHRLSGRTGPYVVYDGASADLELMRSDLFGHRRGAFTGAAEDRQGAFRAADTGTLFLDEIGEIPLELQPRLLRVLETLQVTPVGTDRPVSVDVRVVAATHRDLPAMVRAGTFREDLYHRLAIVPLEIPSLRERPEDIEPLVHHFIRELGLTCRLTPEALAAMRAHPWPGNVRALRNTVEKLGVFFDGREVGPGDLALPEALDPTPEAGEENSGAAPPTRGAARPPTREELKELEKASILAALERNAGNKSRTARELGIPLTTLKRRLKSYGV